MSSAVCFVFIYIGMYGKIIINNTEREHYGEKIFI